ncbi:hypothetical protein [Nocardia salmonicida]|uniref:hypothetical protein n=1 Tax=Nocardia salmonicida TaxID=53431 RepID=UPI0007A454E0|nr:hypothetical protein [Nocardia salmonicida]
MSDTEIITDAYNRRIAALHDTVTAWANHRDVTVAPADSLLGANLGDSGRYSLDLIRNGRVVTLRLLPSWEQQGPHPATIVIEIEDEALRMMILSGDSGMPTAATIKGLLTGLLFPEEMALG